MQIVIYAKSNFRNFIQTESGLNNICMIKAKKYILIQYLLLIH